MRAKDYNLSVPTSFFDLYKIGVGPSSSHTMGPMRAAFQFSRDLAAVSERVKRVQADLYGKIVTALNPRGEAGQTPGVPVVTDLPSNWDAIKPGHLVLTHESLVDGWWEAIVIDRTGDKITLRMRDFPAYEPFTVPVTAVALLNPARS